MRRSLRVKIECANDGTHCGPCRLRTGSECKAFATDRNDPAPGEWGAGVELTSNETGHMRCAECLEGTK